MRNREGFEIKVRSPKSVAEAYAAVTKEFDPADPEVALHPDDHAAVYSTKDGDHRIQGVIEVESEGDDSSGSVVTYGMAIEFGGTLGKIGPIRRRMAAMMQRGVAEELEAELDGKWFA